MSNPAVLLEIDDRGVAEIALNRDERRNAMGKELLEAFADAVAEVRANPDVRAVIVSGRGRHFCSGADLKDGVSALAADMGGGVVALRRALRAIYEPFLSILDVEVPTIAAIHGAAIGGGLGLALACDLRIAAEDARLQGNFVRLGIHPGMAVSCFLPNLVGYQRAAELLFTGRAVTGIEAASMGLVLKAVRAENLMAEAQGLARVIAEGAPEAVKLTKASLRRAVAWDPRTFADGEALAQAHCAQLNDAGEGVAAWLEKRPPRFTGK
jgi:enoyl-CoA hydratase